MFKSNWPMIAALFLLITVGVTISKGKYDRTTSRPIIFTQDSVGNAVVIIPDEIRANDSMLIESQGRNDTANKQTIITLYPRGVRLTSIGYSEWLEMNSPLGHVDGPQAGLIDPQSWEIFDSVINKRK